MSVIVDMRHQFAVVWVRLTPDKYGKYSYDEPFEIRCRWDDEQKEFRNAKGEKAFSRSTVYPDQVLAIGDKMVEGELDSNTPLEPPSTANEIAAFDKIKNFQGTETLYIAYLGGGV